MQLAPPADSLMAQLVAYAIAGHHAGLPDRQGASRATLDARLDAYRDALDPRWRGEIAPAASGLLPAISLIRPGRDDPVSRQKAAFQLAMVGRMLFSCLVDADRRDAEAHDARVRGWQVDRDWPPLGGLLDGLIARYDAHMARFSADGPVNRLRADILALARGKASLPPGIFTLTVPTGGGKTLASLGFALDHARRHGLDRIIYAIPFTSIIDQTAAIFRDVLGEEVVLEHHSALEDEAGERGDVRQLDGDGQRGRLRRAMEDWAPPVVVTTNVQLFESLFAARPSRARKLHNIARSVIVLDEAHTIPLRLLGPAVWALEALVRDWGCSVVLCTATQPALARSRLANSPTAPLIGLELEPDRELAPDPPALARQLKRTTLRQAGPMADADLVDALRETPQALVIVNSRRHALALYRAAEAAGLDGAMHLSTRQYAVERRQILAEVRERLDANRPRPCRLIATSLVEAGVDLDFPRAWRAEVGLDQLVQTAGRVNREGRRPIAESIVTVFEAPDNPAPPEIAGFVGDMRRMQREFADDLFTPEAISRYFEEVYWRKGHEQLDRGVTDKESILAKFALDRLSGTVFAYRSAAENFRMIESGMAPVIIPGDEIAEQAVRQLSDEMVPTGRLARTLQRYTVAIPPRARDKLIEAGHASFVAADLRGEAFVVLQHMDLYHKDVGLIWEDAGYLSAEQLIV
jgi:CRISPR-associated endonuclease/helicase Cas3